MKLLWTTAINRRGCYKQPKCTSTVTLYHLILIFIYAWIQELYYTELTHTFWCNMCMLFLNFVSNYILELKLHVLSLQLIMYFNSVVRFGVYNSHTLGQILNTFFLLVYLQLILNLAPIAECLIIQNHSLLQYHTFNTVHTHIKCLLEDLRIINSVNVSTLHMVYWLPQWDLASFCSITEDCSHPNDKIPSAMSVTPQDSPSGLNHS